MRSSSARTRTTLIGCGLFYVAGLLRTATGIRLLGLLVAPARRSRRVRVLANTPTGTPRPGAEQPSLLPLREEACPLPRRQPGHEVDRLGHERLQVADQVAVSAGRDRPGELDPEHV